MKEVTIWYEVAYESWMETPRWGALHLDKIIAANDNDALRKFNDLKIKYERCENFTLTKIVTETQISQYCGLSKKITTITEIQLA